ncbi:MAG: sensor histidine kinase [Stygiobacter sp.]
MLLNNSLFQWRLIKNASYMGHLIEDLLRLSRVTQLGIVKKVTDIKEIFNKCISETQATNYKFIINDLPLIPADPSLIEIAIRNLVNNAIKFSRTVENPTIEINAEENDNEVIYSIKDNGVGFNMEYYDKIFIAFQRLHSTDKFEGTGIGLSIVQRIIKKHGGNVWAEGKENEGATFYFSLPKK